MLLDAGALMSAVSLLLYLVVVSGLFRASIFVAFGVDPWIGVIKISSPIAFFLAGVGYLMRPATRKGKHLLWFTLLTFAFVTFIPIFAT